MRSGPIAWPIPGLQEPPTVEDPVIGLTVGDGVVGLTFDQAAIERELAVQAEVTRDAERLMAALMEPCCCRPDLEFAICDACNLRRAWRTIEKAMAR